MNYNYKWIEFLSTNNTLMITNENEFNHFKMFLQRIEMLDILKNNTHYSDWQYASKINEKNPNYIIFEYDNNRGLTFGYTKEASKKWYGKEPLTVKDIELLKDINKRKTVPDRGR